MALPAPAVVEAALPPIPVDDDAEESAGIENGNAAIALAVNTLFDQWETNRTRVEAKWNKNWSNYVGDIYEPWKKGEATGDRSSTHIQVTKSRVMMAYALVIDLVLQGGEVPMDLRLGKWQGQSVDALPPEVRAELERRCASMKARIKGNLAAGACDRELSKLILSGAIFGEGYLKRGVRDFEEAGWEPDLGDEDPEGMAHPLSANIPWTKKVSVLRGPSASWVPLWDIYRDMEEHDPSRGKGFIHRQMQSAFWLRSKIGRAYFQKSGILRALKKHTGETNADTGLGSRNSANTDGMSPALRMLTHRTKTLQVLEFWGRLPRHVVESYEAEAAGDDTQANVLAQQDNREGDEVECHVMVCDSEVVRFTRTKRQDRPLMRFVWEEGLEPDEATGVADNVGDLQKVTNGAFRAIEDNIRQVCNVVWAIKEQYIVNSAEIKKNGMTPGTVVWMREGIQSINEIIQQLQARDITAPLVGLVELCVRMIDTDSLIPRSQMGAMDNSRNTTAYEISQQLANSSKYLGAVIRRLDETIIEPLVAYVYDYAMLDPTFPDKGPFVVVATGYQAYHDRLLAFDQIQRMTAMFMSNPVMAVHANVRWAMESMAKALDQSPEQALVPQEQAMQMLQAMQTDPLKLAQQNKADADARQSQAQAMKLMNDIKISLENLKLERAEMAMKLRESQAGMKADAEAAAKK